MARNSARLTTMSVKEVDTYLSRRDHAKRINLEARRAAILEVIPDAEQCISYGMPAFKVEGNVIAGFAAFKNHLSYLPHSGSVIPALADDLKDYDSTKGS